MTFFVLWNRLQLVCRSRTSFGMAVRMRGRPVYIVWVCADAASGERFRNTCRSVVTSGWRSWTYEERALELLTGFQLESKTSRAQPRDKQQFYSLGEPAASEREPARDAVTGSRYEVRVGTSQTALSILYNRQTDLLILFFFFFFFYLSLRVVSHNYRNTWLL